MESGKETFREAVDEPEREPKLLMSAKNSLSEQQTRELSDCSSREADEGKPAKNTLKKTFTSLLSRMQIGKLAADGSSVTDTESLCENTSQWILDIATSWPYFRVKLSCVCLKFTYKKKSKNKMVKKDTQYLLLVGFKKLNTKRKGDTRLAN